MSELGRDGRYVRFAPFFLAWGIYAHKRDDGVYARFVRYGLFCNRQQTTLTNCDSVLRSGARFTR
jgi:hypothetical protein